ncbi:MAG: cell division topological specificity factor MinE [Succinivibrionaceae bacterium]
MVFNLFKRKQKEIASAAKAKERLLQVCIAQTGGSEPTELIQKIKAAVLEVLNNYYKTNIDTNNVCTNLKRENETSYIDLQVNLPGDDKH